ncbi:hypothetical protein LTR17_024339 [Elasticomyces elasticus]|nr:hypothetical protein LTR17_024339 [Elasticomyces elasticus]
MEGDVLAARLDMMPATHILKHVPRRIGRNRALDAAVTCIMQTPSLSDGTKASRLYSAALCSLRKSLDDPAQLHAPETLAAASLLQMYEQYSDHPSRQWVYHARGVVKMLQAKGASHLNDEMEKAILEAQAGNTSSLGMIVDGVRHPDIDNLCASLVLQCEYDLSIPLRHRVMVDTSALMNMLRMREQLQTQMKISRDYSDNLTMSYPIRVTAYAAYAATSFFVIADNIFVLELYEQLVRLAPDGQPQWPAGITGELLKAERESALQTSGCDRPAGAHHGSSSAAHYPCDCARHRWIQQYRGRDAAACP